MNIDGAQRIQSIFPITTTTTSTSSPQDVTVNSLYVSSSQSLATELYELYSRYCNQPETNSDAPLPSPVPMEHYKVLPYPMQHDRKLKKPPSIKRLDTSRFRSKIGTITQSDWVQHCNSLIYMHRKTPCNGRSAMWPLLYYDYDV